MKKDSHSIPRRRTGAVDQIEIRPLYVEEWLDSLPYIDFQKTSRLLFEATRATNEAAMKPANRLELVELYNRPYQYYINSQIRTGAQHTLQSIETMQEQTEPLKQIAVNLGYACRIAGEEMLKQKSLWRQNKPPLPALLSSLTYLSHALIFSFLEYAPTPKNAWREIHFTYGLAEKLDKHHALVVPIGGNPKKDASSVTDAYRRIIMASLADPHHLPFGAIWEIYDLLGQWARHIEIEAFRSVNRHGGLFVVDLDADARPVPYVKFNVKNAGGTHRLVDAASMGGLIEEQMERLNAGQGLEDHISLSPYFAKAVLAHMGQAWGLPAKRHAPRKAGSGSLHLACGLNATHYFLSGGRDFSPEPPPDAEDDAADMAATDLSETAGNYIEDTWSLVDEGPGGFAVIKNDKPVYTVRVGDLLAVSPRSAESPEKRDWSVGIIRWMMVRQGKAYRIGVQILPGSVTPAAIRAVSGSSHDRRPRRALLLLDPRRPEEQSVLTDRGLYQERRELELSMKGRTIRLLAGTTLEATVGFEYFSLNSP